MRITNTSGSPRFFAYIGAGGKTLGNGETSPDMPLSLLYGTGMSADIMDKQASVNVGKGTLSLWNDLSAGHCTVAMSADDTLLMAHVAALIA